MQLFERTKTKHYIQYPEDDFGSALNLGYYSSHTVTCQLKPLTPPLFLSTILVISFLSYQLSSSEFYQILCLFSLQGGHHWRPNGSEKGYPWRRHIYELGPGDGKEEAV